MCFGSQEGNKKLNDLKTPGRWLKSLWNVWSFVGTPGGLFREELTGNGIELFNHDFEKKYFGQYAWDMMTTREKFCKIHNFRRCELIEDELLLSIGAIVQVQQVKVFYFYFKTCTYTFIYPCTCTLERVYLVFVFLFKKSTKSTSKNTFVRALAYSYI